MSNNKNKKIHNHGLTKNTTTTKDYHSSGVGRSSGFLLKRGNVGLTRLLLAVYNAGPGGISTIKLLKQLNSITHGQGFLKRAVREGYIKRNRQPKPKGQKGNHYTVNYLTPKGKDLLKRL